MDIALNGSGIASFSNSSDLFCENTHAYPTITLYSQTAAKKQKLRLSLETPYRPELPLPYLALQTK